MDGQRATPGEISAEIARRVAVDHQLLVRAKDAVLKLVLAGVVEGEQLVARALLDLGAKRPGTVIIPSDDIEAQLQPVIEYVSCRLATCEALWMLLGSGVVIPGNAGPFQVTDGAPAIAYDHPAGRSGSSGSLRHESFACTYPTSVRAAPSLRFNPPRLLSDGDLYLRDLGIDSQHPLIEESLRDAVRCFRQDLYLPAVAMLGRAMEASWTEVGFALASYGGKNGDSAASKLSKDLGEPQYGLYRRIRDVSSYYKRKPLFESLQQTCGIDDRGIDQIASWSDLVRDSRNVIHFQATASVPNTYEKVAALLLGAIPNLRDLHRVKAHSERPAQESI
jgi:hypothetical protein